ncbi:zinc finger protein 276 isoform X3 [Erythrolamprus reginae]|uniref:zinc finger protein 276 isoform X3 n=1 Tax=Erythrolamprus reginae TaxID=121349 RepID=UPI00396C998F
MKRDRRGRFLPAALGATIAPEAPPGSTRPHSGSRTRRRPAEEEEAAAAEKGLQKGGPAQALPAAGGGGRPARPRPASLRLQEVPRPVLQVPQHPQGLHPEGERLARRTPQDPTRKDQPRPDLTARCFSWRRGPLSGPDHLQPAVPSPAGQVEPRPRRDLPDGPQPAQRLVIQVLWDRQGSLGLRRGTQLHYEHRPGRQHLAGRRCPGGPAGTEEGEPPARDRQRGGPRQLRGGQSLAPAPAQRGKGRGQPAAGRQWDGFTGARCRKPGSREPRFAFPTRPLAGGPAPSPLPPVGQPRESSDEEENHHKAAQSSDDSFEPYPEKRVSNSRKAESKEANVEEPKARKKPGPKPGWKIKCEREELPNIYKCPYQGCTAVYRGADGMKKHIKEHHEEVRERPCPHPGCNKVFMIDRYLQRHVKLIHTEVRNYICDECGQTFKQRKHLSVHQMRHSGAKPLQCEICGFQCRQRASLKYHMTKHKAEAELDFACDQCGKRFEKAHNLNVHMSMVHPLTQTQEKAKGTEARALLETVEGQPIKEEASAQQEPT